MIPKFLAALLAIILTAGTAFAADKTPPADGVINDNVMIKLASDQVVKGGALKIDVKDGVVTISGTVENDRQKERASKLAKQVKGVKKVINNINLKDTK